MRSGQHYVQVEVMETLNETAAPRKMQGMSRLENGIKRGPGDRVSQAEVGGTLGETAVPRNMQGIGFRLMSRLVGSCE